MKAIVFDQFGKADVLRLADIPLPKIRSTDLMVKVMAVGVNRADILQREGFYGTQTYGESDLLGLELSGQVIAVGDEVNDISVGDKVMAIVGGGAYAEFARVDRAMAVKMPDELSFVEAAAVMESFVTAWEALVHLGELASDTAVLIHAAAGGIGSAAVQIASALDATVFATATSHRKAEVQNIGAQTVFDYSSEDFEQGVRLLTDGQGIDIIVDFVGGDYLARNLRSLRPGGRLIQVGLLSGKDEAEMPLGLLLHNHLQLIGTVMKSRSHAEKLAMIRRFAENGLPLLASGLLRPVIGKEFPLSQAGDAHRYMEAGGGFGKTILTLEE